MEILDDLKTLWLANRERHKFNPMLREIREVIRKHDPQWDDQTFPPAPKFNIVMPGANKPTET